MKNLIILFLFSASLVFGQRADYRGKVIDSQSGKPLPGANIIVKGAQGSGTATGDNGIFKLTGNFNSTDIISVSYVGYITEHISIGAIKDKSNIIIKLDPKIIPAQTVLVEGGIAKEGVTPLTFNKVKRKEIDEDYTVQDIPEYLSSLPSTTFYSENGNGIGYNYLSIRGFDQRRISVSINGIPQNDPEDHNVYWLDFPDLLASTEMIQIQRGAGSGVFGYPAIGGSINIITSTFSNEPKINFSASMGSYNTRKYSASFSSGLIDKKYSIYAKLSQILSGGYRNSSWVRFNSFHLSAVRYDDKLTTQVNIYGGPVADALAYTGLPKFAVKNKELRRANYSYWETNGNQYTYTLTRRPDEIENFSQPHFELMNEYKFNNKVTINSALFLILGSGFFDYDGSWADTSYFRLTAENGFKAQGNPQNALIRAQVENRQYGWIPRISIKHNNGELIVGGEFRNHRSVHWGSINYGENLPEGLTKDFRYYYYNAGKNIITGFAHETYNLTGNINLLGEVQVAYHKYKLYNEKYVGYDFSISNLFINPRFGINYKFNKIHNLYFSFARVSREPRLKNYYDAAESGGGAVPNFETKGDGTYDFGKPLVEPETMNDFELGTGLNSKNYAVTLNLFYMLFNNEIVKNGKIDRFGQPVTGNVKSTYHTGIEFSANYHLIKGLDLFGNATYSNNKISDGKYYLSTNEYIVLNGNRISGFPDFLANVGLNYNYRGLFFQFTGKYVGSFYSDNYDSRLASYLIEHPGFVSYTDNKNDAYFTADILCSYKLPVLNSLTPSKLFVQVNNVFDNLYSANAIGAEFFPAAGRNFLFGLRMGL